MSYCGVSPGIDFVGIRPVTAPDGLPKIADREAFALTKLMDVAKLVQEQRFIEGSRLVQKHGTADRDRVDVGCAERPAADARRDAADAKARVAKLGVPLCQLPR